MNCEMANLAKSYDLLEEKYYDILDSHHHLEWEYNKQREKIRELEAAIKQILWKLTRKATILIHGSNTELCQWAKIDINDACLNEAKALISERME